ncbi:MAG: bifunctional UDP-N-acetylglucosamine diphosphorylase/glucosamine-1-phosphate N-acetyltransferase GlmU, partial [Betaproteobacteria bacterium]|nr:bifunctional UDP-N-acetylglucosamine diphosphorylase/glucosamine-1-phosphate N-acetyltransferase GlmU [Betaproteobacteria bacterium]
MTDRKTVAVILAAGLGTRMKSDRPKVMHPLAGQPMIAHLLGTLEPLGLDKTVVVIGDGMEDVADIVKPHATVVQSERLGTAHAVLAARDFIESFEGELLILYGDTPLVSAATLEAMLTGLRAPEKPAAITLGFKPDDPGMYGRLIIGEDGNLEKIVEARDATPEQLQVPLCNSGVMALDGATALDYLSRIGNDNTKGEYYLTDIITISAAEQRSCQVVEGETTELLGINSRAELAIAEAVVQSQLRGAALAGGATLTDPTTVYFSFDTKIGQDVSIGPNVFFGPDVTVEDRVEIRAFCHIEGATVSSGAIVGPFARLRPGAVLEKDVHVGNFVEIKNATLETGSKANHLTYIGDARVGSGANIGAGTIT